MFQMIGVFAGFERAIIRERVIAGLARAKSEGRRLGRPTISTDVEKQILECAHKVSEFRRLLEALTLGSRLSNA